MNFSDAFLRVEKEKDYIVNFLKKMVAVDTTVPPGEKLHKAGGHYRAGVKRFRL